MCLYVSVSVCVCMCVHMCMYMCVGVVVYSLSFNIAMSLTPSACKKMIGINSICVVIDTFHLKLK